MSTLKGLLALTLTLGLTAAATAVPNLVGPTGLLLTPTAQTLQEDEYNLSAATIEGGDSLGYAMNYGVRPNLEVGFTRLPDAETIINAKYAIQPETARRIGIAAGVVDLTNQETTSIYAVGSKHVNIKGLYGVNNFQFSLGLAGGGDNSTPHGLFGGATFDIDKFATVILEHDGNSLNYGLRVPFARNFVAQGGVIDENHDLALGVSYNGRF